MMREREEERREPLDDPANPDRGWREMAARELGFAITEAQAEGDEARAEAARNWLGRLATERDGMAALADWGVMSRASQRPPQAPWRVWLMMGGRGAGKTRAGAEWIRAVVDSGEARRVALVGPTLGDVREVMIEGPSGLKAIAQDDARPTYEVSRHRITWPNGALGYVFSAEDPDSLRGPQFDAAWCDEIGAWPRDVATWDNLMFGLRLGAAPRVVATTTPRPRELVKKLAVAGGVKGDPPRGGVALTRAATSANALRLSPGWLDSINEAYAGTRVGRQELEGELMDDPDDAMFTRGMIEKGRIQREEVGELERIVVAVDPPASAHGRSDACGIVAAGLRGGIVYVLEDATVRGLRPQGWAEAVVATAQRVGAGVIVAEGNNGGEMVRTVLEMAGATPANGLRIRMRHASKSKSDRAEPVSQLYERAQVRHAGVFRELEDEMCRFGARSEVKGEQPASPDRMDAMVWAVSELTEKRATPRADVL